MLPAHLRLKRSSDFKRVYRFGRRIEGRRLVLYYYFSKLPALRFGFSISRKIGKATQRNRCKRLLSAVCYKNNQRFKPGHDVVIVVKEDINSLHYREVEKEVLKLAEKAKLLLKINKEVSKLR